MKGMAPLRADYPALLIYAISVQRQNGIAGQMALRLHAAEDKESDIAVGYHIGHDLLYAQVLSLALAADGSALGEKRAG